MTFDTDTFLQNSYNDLSFACEIAVAALDVINRSLPDFEAAMAKEDAEAIYLSIHDMKSVTGTLQLDELHGVILKLETWAQEDQLEACAVVAENFKTLTQQAQEEIHQFIEGAQTSKPAK
jgi:HPt (histidine-containing phosphotransfer) domain-containing protein